MRFRAKNIKEIRDIRDSVYTYGVFTMDTRIIYYVFSRSIKNIKTQVTGHYFPYSRICRVSDETDSVFLFI